MIRNAPKGTNIRIPPDLAEKLKDQTPKHVPLSVFCAVLLEQALDKGFTLIAPSESREPESISSEGAISTNVLSTKESTNTESIKNNTRAKKTDRFARKALPEDAIPDDLLDVQQLLEEFWSVKKGVRSERAWNRLCTKLRGFTPDDRRKALEAACTAGWADVYEPKPERRAAPGRAPAKSLTEQARELGMI